MSSACEANAGSSSCSITSGSGTWTGNGFGQAYGYDSYNNRWIYPNGTIPVLIFAPTSSSAYDASTNRFSATNFGGTFDGAGQMTAHSAVTDATSRADDKYDGAGQRVESKYTYSGAANTNTMVYDGLGRRVKKLNPGYGDTYYVYDTFGNMAAEYGAGAGTVCDPCYLFQDPVGSMRLVVDKNQVAVKRYDTMPFGEQISGGGGWGNGRSGTAYSPASTVKWRFGGGYKDDQNGEWPVTVMGARGLYPGYGRFDRADENLVDQGVGDPLSWNLFSYARNNPLVYSDPTGRACQHNSDGSIVDDGAGAACDFGQFMGAQAKFVEVAPATMERAHSEWALGILAEAGKRASDGSAVLKGWKQSLSITAPSASIAVDCAIGSEECSPSGIAMSVLPVGKGRTIGKRSPWQKKKFLRSLAEDYRTPEWMKPWLRKGLVPPGYNVEHKVPLSIGGKDHPTNMRLLLESDHKLHHEFYHP